MFLSNFTLKKDDLSLENDVGQNITGWSHNMDKIGTPLSIVFSPLHNTMRMHYVTIYLYHVLDHFPMKNFCFDRIRMGKSLGIEHRRTNEAG